MVTFIYDNDGKRITKNHGANSWSYSYDYENRLKQVTLNGQQVFQAWYDGDGRRIKTADPTTTTVSDYLPGSWDPVYQEDLGAGVFTDLVFAGNLRIGKIQAGQPYYYHLDHLGSVRLTTDNIINQVFQTFYKPYGSLYATSGNPERFSYTGKQQDASTGLFYYGYRYYDPQTGRFITQDNYPAVLTNSQSINHYSFALNNPNLYIDPDGRFYQVCPSPHQGIDAVLDFFLGIVMEWAGEYFGTGGPDASPPGQLPGCGPPVTPGTHIKTKVIIATDSPGEVTAVVISKVTTTTESSGKTTIDRTEIDTITIDRQAGETVVEMTRDISIGDGPTREFDHIRVTDKSGLPLGSGWI